MQSLEMDDWQIPHENDWQIIGILNILIIVSGNHSVHKLPLTSANCMLLNHPCCSIPHLFLSTKVKDVWLFQMVIYALSAGTLSFPPPQLKAHQHPTASVLSVQYEHFQTELPVSLIIVTYGWFIDEFFIFWKLKPAKALAVLVSYTVYKIKYDTFYIW